MDAAYAWSRVLEQDLSLETITGKPFVVRASADGQTLYFIRAGKEDRSVSKARFLSFRQLWMSGTKSRASFRNNFGLGSPARVTSYLFPVFQWLDKLEAPNLIANDVTFSLKTPKRNWNYESASVWRLLTNVAAARLTTTYEEVGRFIGTNPLSVGKTLGPIQIHCMERGLPPLTVIVVSKTTGRPGPGFVACEPEDIPNATENVWQFPWGRTTNPLGLMDKSDTDQALIEKLLQLGESAEEVYAKVRSRGIVQQLFALALRKAYNHQCAFCGATFDEILEGAHIIPWSDATKSQRVDIRNGFCCAASITDCSIPVGSGYLRSLRLSLRIQSLPSDNTRHLT